MLMLQVKDLKIFQKILLHLKENRKEFLRQYHLVIMQ